MNTDVAGLQRAMTEAWEIARKAQELATRS